MQFACMNMNRMFIISSTYFPSSKCIGVSQGWDVRTVLKIIIVVVVIVFFA